MALFLHQLDMNIKTRIKQLKVKAKWFILEKLLNDDEWWMADHSWSVFVKNTKRLYEFMYPSTGQPFSFSDLSVKRACDWTYGAKRVAFSTEHDPESPMNGLYNAENSLLKLLQKKDPVSGGAVINEPIKYEDD